MARFEAPPFDAQVSVVSTRNCLSDVTFRNTHFYVLTDQVAGETIVLSTKSAKQRFMSSDAGNYELYLAVPEGADDEELDEYRRNLQRELNEVEGVDRVEQISAGKAPENARAIDLVVIGALAIALKKSGAFDAVLGILKTWIESGNRRREKRKIVIKRPDGTMLQFDGYSFKEIGNFQNPADQGNKP